VVRALTTGAEGSGSKQHSLCMGFFNNSPFQPAINGYLALFRAREGEGGEEEEWQPPSHMVTMGYRNNLYLTQ